MIYPNQYQGLIIYTLDESVRFRDKKADQAPREIHMLWIALWFLLAIRWVSHRLQQSLGLRLKAREIARIWPGRGL